MSTVKETAILALIEQHRTHMQWAERLRAQADTLLLRILLGGPIDVFGVPVVFTARTVDPARAGDLATAQAYARRQLARMDTAS